MSSFRSFMKPFDLVMIYIANEDHKYHCPCINIDHKFLPSHFQADISFIILSSVLSNRNLNVDEVKFKRKFSCSSKSQVNVFEFQKQVIKSFVNQSIFFLNYSISLFLYVFKVCRDEQMDDNFELKYIIQALSGEACDRMHTCPHTRKSVKTCDKQHAQMKYWTSCFYYIIVCV